MTADKDKILRNMGQKQTQPFPQGHQFRNLQDNALEKLLVPVQHMPGLVNDPYISPGCLHPVFHIIGSFTAGKDVRPPHHPVPVIGMHHIHEFVIKQFLNLVPGIPNY